MTHAELVVNLLSKSFIAFVDTPILIETKPDGTEMYSVNVREEVGDSALYRNVYYYVTSAGLAFYKDKAPAQTITNDNFKDFVESNYKATKPEILGMQWASIEEPKREGLIKAIVPSVEAGLFSVVGYMVADVGGSLVMLEIDLPSEVIAGQ